MVLSKLVFSAIAVLIFSVIYNEYKVQKSINPNELLDIDKLLEHYGYPCEVHEVVTEDGYILNLQRIPYGKNDKNTNVSRVPVLFAHCLACSARDFISTGPETSLPCILADMGYDVWLYNARGSPWSRKHTKFNANTDKEYWNFSLTELGIYDLPATIDYVIQKNGQTKIHYIGLSQGTAIFFILTSIKPNYNNKIRLSTCLAPCPFLKNIKSRYLKLLIAIQPFYELFLGDAVLHENSIESKTVKLVCHKNSMFYGFCNHFISNVVGRNDKEKDLDKLPAIYAGLPRACSKIQLMQVFQWTHDSSDFQDIDLGEEGNVNKYGQKTPLVYPLQKVSAPVAIYYANNDYLVSNENVEYLINLLPNVVKQLLINDEEFNHLDFIFAKNVYKKVYQHVISEMQKY